ncbi:MAG: 30S ribosomal protein S2 [Victivallales bacterium]|nr:30S ribosomal protein S2 [Victivallales bacterium]
MAKVTIKDLLEAGCHFGHQTKRWDPRMKKYVYGVRNGISIIDLTKTMHQIADACNFLQQVVIAGGDVLFVGTKRQAQQIIAEVAEKTGMYHVSERWLGGTLTNRVTIKKSIAKMYEIDKLLESEEAKGLKKKELASHSRKVAKLHRNLDGVARMKKLPGIMIVVDVSKDDIAVREAVKLKIPVIGICDTNSNPELVGYPIAANDDAVKSIKVIIDVLVDAILVAKEIHQKRVAEEKAEKEAEKAEKEAAAKAEKEKTKKAAPKAEKKAESENPASKPDKPRKPRKTAPKAEAGEEIAAESEETVEAEAAEKPKKDKVAAPKAEKKAESASSEEKTEEKVEAESKTAE